MKKIVFAAAAAATLTLGGAACAHGLDDVLANIFGHGGAVTGTGKPAPADGSAPIQGSYRDEYGRLWVVEQGGRHVMIPEGASYGITGYDGNGRPLYGVVSSGGGYAAASRDWRDRRPFDARRR